jgi:beta-galactosidase
MEKDDAMIAEASKLGLPIAANALHMADWLAIDKWSKPETRAEYRRIMELEIRRWRNQPGVVMWVHTGNSFGSANDPWVIGKRDHFNVQEYRDRVGRGLQATGMIRAVDPTRPVFAHHGAYNGDVYTSNMYLNFIPLQEREEWLSEWARNGQMPFMVVEFGVPLYSSLMRGRDGYGPQGNSEPFLSEWVAREFGTEAYAMEPQAYRQDVIAKRFKGGDLQKEYEPHMHGDGQRIVMDSPGFSRLLDRYITHTWRSWRTMGITGGMIPWSTSEHPALKKVNGPSLAWIAGAGGTPVPSDKAQKVLPPKTTRSQPASELRSRLSLSTTTARLSHTPPDGQ